MEKQKEEQSREHNAGITLIALIITIIILLILAMVTIRILMNQGIIKHAQNATEAYNDAQNNETEYLTYAEGEMDKYAGVTGGGSGSGETYTPPAEDVDALKKYFMGTKEDGSINEAGQSLMTHTSDGTTWEDDEATIGSGSNVSMFMAPYATDKDGTTYFYYYIKYKNQDAYRLAVDMSSMAVKDVVFVYRPQGAEGETRTYKGEQWTVLYDKGTTLELVSPKTIGTYTLGKDDPNAAGSTDIEKAIDSYNNAVTRLNAYCRTTLSDNTARSVGCSSVSPDSDNPGMYTSENLASLAEGAYNGVGKKPDDNGEQDFIRMVYHGVNVAKDAQGNDTNYWLASRVVDEVSSSVHEYSSIVGFDVRLVDSTGSAGCSYLLWGVNSSGASSNGPSYAVRPVVRVNKSDVGL